MSILSGTGRIVLVREPVSGRFGLPRLLAKVSANAFRTNWHGTEEISVIVFNRKMTIAKILKYEISYFRILHIVRLRLKVTTLISSIPFHFTLMVPELSIAMSLCMPKRPHMA